MGEGEGEVEGGESKVGGNPLVPSTRNLDTGETEEDGHETKAGGSIPLGVGASY